MGIYPVHNSESDRQPLVLGIRPTLQGILLTIHRYSQPQEEQIVDRDSTLSSGPYVEMSTATFFFFYVGRREGTYLLFADLTNKRER